MKSNERFLNIKCSWEGKGLLARMLKGERIIAQVHDIKMKHSEWLIGKD